MMMKSIVTAVAVLTLLSGCNAARGLGQDIENLGLLMQGKKAQKKAPVQQGEVVSEVVTTTAPAEVVIEPDTKATAMPAEPKVEVYPYPYPQDQGGNTAYTLPEPKPAR